LEAQFDVLLVKRAVVLRGVDQSWRILKAQLLVLLVNRARDEKGVERSVTLFA